MIPATDPQSDIGRLSLTNVLMAEERQDEAAAVPRRMLARSPDHLDACRVLDDVLSFAGTFEAAGLVYQRPIEAGRRGVRV